MAKLKNGPNERLQIGELAGRLDLNPKTIRYYEQIGLLPKPDRTEGGYRLYTTADEERLRFITSARQVGLSLGEIKEILALRDRGEAPCEYVATAIDLQLAELDRKIADLRQLKGDLTALQRRARHIPRGNAAARYCHILERS